MSHNQTIAPTAPLNETELDQVSGGCYPTEPPAPGPGLPPEPPFPLPIILPFPPFRPFPLPAPYRDLVG